MAISSHDERLDWTLDYQGGWLVGSAFRLTTGAFRMRWSSATRKGVGVVPGTTFRKVSTDRPLNPLRQLHILRGQQPSSKDLNAFRGEPSNFF